MKITTQHLDAVRSLLVKASTELEDQTRQVRTAEEKRVALDGRVRRLQGAFDVCASSYAQHGQDISESQLTDLPEEAQDAIGYEKISASDVGDLHAELGDLK